MKVFKVIRCVQFDLVWIAIITYIFLFSLDFFTLIKFYTLFLFAILDSGKTEIFT